MPTSIAYRVIDFVFVLPKTRWIVLFRYFLLSLCLLASSCKGAEPSEDLSKADEDVIVGDEETLRSLDYSTALVTHELGFAGKSLEAKTSDIARKAGTQACLLAQTSSGATEASKESRLKEDLVHEVQSRGHDPYLGLEIARFVAACYARKNGKKIGDQLTKAMFLALASNCASRRGATGDQMSRLMLALYDSQEVSLASYMASVSHAKSRSSFANHLLYGTEMCPRIAGGHSGLEEAGSSPAVSDPSGADVKGRVYVGILRGRAPGRVRLVVKDRNIDGSLTIGAKKIVVSGKIGRFNTLNITGRLGMEAIELKGKIKERARKMRGRYNGKIRRRNQARTSRVIGFWEANLEVEPSP